MRNASGEMGRRACVFCKATDRKISKEHVWPKWLRKVIEGAEGPASEHGRIIKSRDGETLWHDTWKDIPINWQVAAPCKHCNEGWMEGIEVETRPILTPLIQHGDAELGDFGETRHASRQAGLRGR
jgi:hypothetical protein